MTPKEHLSKVKRIYDLIHDIEIEIQMMNANRDGLTGISFDKELVQTSLTDAGLENQIIQIEQRENRLEELKQEYQLIREKVQSNINALKNERERKVLILRYLDFKEWSEIFAEMNATQDIVYSLHKRALNHYKP